MGDNLKKIDSQIIKGEGSQKLNKTILLIEDDEFLREICVKKLIKEGFDVSVAVDGEQAIKEMDKIEPDLILLDIILPTMNGYEVLQKIKAHKNIKIRQVPIIVLSNLGQENDIKKAMDMGATDYLIKAHFTTEEITDKVKKVLGIH